jgi:hypothetical protein
VAPAMILTPVCGGISPDRVVDNFHVDTVFRGQKAPPVFCPLTNIFPFRETFPLIKTMNNDSLTENFTKAGIERP